MSQTYTTIDLATQSAADVLGHLATRTDTLRSAFSGSTAPSSPVAGQTWLDESATERVFKAYFDAEGSGAGWYEVGSVLHGNLKLRNNQLVDARLENLSSHTTPASGVVGEAYLYTTDAKARLIVSATKREVILSASNVDYMAIDLFAGMQRDATNPPTAGTKGTTPTCRGWLFDATNELASFVARVPQGYSGDANLKLRLLCVLNAAETANDDIDWTCDYTAAEPSSAEAVSKTSTSVTAAKDMGSTVAEGSVHVVDITLDYADATNPIAAGDVLTLEVHRTDLANCSGVILVGAQLLVPVGIKVTE